MADVWMQPGERVDSLQLAGMRILQKEQGFRFGMDAVLLADFARVRPGDWVADFGTGTGILPLLLIGRGKGATFDALEVQPEMADMAARTMRLNGLEERVRVHAVPVAEALTVLPPRSVAHVVCNPPYGQPGCTMKNPSESLSQARHLDENGLTPWFQAASAVLRDRGRLSVVYPAQWMLSAMCAMQEAGLEPKRFRLVYPWPEKPPNLALIEAVKGGRPPLQPEPPLMVRNADGTDSAELRRIYHLPQEDA